MILENISAAGLVVNVTLMQGRPYRALYLEGTLTVHDQSEEHGTRFSLMRENRVNLSFDADSVSITSFNAKEEIPRIVIRDTLGEDEEEK